MRVNDTLAYYTTELIMGVKSFMAMPTKKATTVLYCRVHGINMVEIKHQHDLNA
jgi:hypothetical protein